MVIMCVGGCAIYTCVREMVLNRYQIRTSFFFFLAFHLIFLYVLARGLLSFEPNSVCHPHSLYICCILPFSFPNDFYITH